MKSFFQKQTEECQVHGGHAKKANGALLVMVFASLALIIWHVWVYGTSGKVVKFENSSNSFPLLIVNEIWDLLFNKRGVVPELWEVFPYFIVGILLAGYLRTYKIAVKLQASLRKYGVLSIFIASFVGIITPLCACGTLTTAISLLFAGLPLAPVMSLMITSSLLSPSTYLVTLNDLGPEWTVIRTIAALFMGVFAGLVTQFLRTRGFETKNLFIEGAITRGDFHDEDYPDERLRCNCKQKFGNRVAVRTDNKFLIFLAKSSEMLWMVGKYIIVGVVMGAIVERYMPTGWVYRFFGQKDPLNIVWVTMVSVPMFLHQLSASSILAHVKGALDGTLDGGAALAFMIGGPVTAVPTMILFWTIFKKRVFALYMFVCLGGTILIAYTFQAFVFVPGVDTGNELLRGVSQLSGGKSAVLAKQGSNVRMVMDPGGKGLIATFRNELDGQGGVVFDAGYERFLAASSDMHDNRKYFVNAAKWLRDNSDAQARPDILVYDISSGRHEVLSKMALADFDRAGFKVKIVKKGDAEKITSASLANYGQLWLVFSGDSRLADSEFKAVSQFNGDGKGMLIVAGAGSQAAEPLMGVNQLSAKYGVTFSGNADSRGEISVGMASRIFANASEVLGKFLKIVHKA
ncbi:permease [Geobacter pelophilus]|uniref:Permease n=1 Tax=Geoanaerobacter pelophilus TaxID=60036 RepID=A0AAW4L422_9BACT|nr:permease [Geoanaerobacter pelophilus]MBT0664937.1 permease [Geoanaerobacter pelophilus]